MPSNKEYKPLKSISELKKKIEKLGLDKIGISLVVTFDVGSNLASLSLSQQLKTNFEKILTTNLPGKTDVLINGDKNYRVDISSISKIELLQDGKVIQTVLVK